MTKQTHDHTDNQATDASNELTTLRAEYDKFKDKASLYAESVVTELYNKKAEIEALKAENVRLRGGGWLPIESAPRDGGSVILSAVGSSVVKQGYYSKRYDVWFDESDRTIFPNRWQPLPLPPKPEGEPDA